MTNYRLDYHKTAQTILGKNYRKACERYGNLEIVAEGHTGGAPYSAIDAVEYFHSSERNNCFAECKRLSILTPTEQRYPYNGSVKGYRLKPGYHVITGAKYGGGRHALAKQVEYLIAKEA